MSDAVRAGGEYKTTNWVAYNAALKSRGSLTIWPDRGMQWLATPNDKRGRQRVFGDATIQFCLSIKCLFGLVQRQSLGLVESQLRLVGLDWPVPDYSTISRRQQTLQVQLPYLPSHTALDLLVDSTGIKFIGEGEWRRKKHGAEYRRQSRKVHLAIDAHSMEVQAIEVIDNGVGDEPMLPELLNQIPPDEPIASVSVDRAYDTKACHAAIAQRQAHALIPPRKNASLWKVKHIGDLARNEAVRACVRLGRWLCKKWSGYHRRRLVETKMHCFKRLGERVMARTFERQVAESHVRVALLNRFTELGRPTTVPVMAVAQPRLGLVSSRPELGLCNRALLNET